MSTTWPQAHRSALLTKSHGAEVLTRRKPAGSEGSGLKTLFSTRRTPSNLSAHHCLTSSTLSKIVASLEHRPKAMVLLARRVLFNLQDRAADARVPESDSATMKSVQRADLAFICTAANAFASSASFGYHSRRTKCIERVLDQHLRVSPCACWLLNTVVRSSVVVKHSASSSL